MASVFVVVVVFSFLLLSLFFCYIFLGDCVDRVNNYTCQCQDGYTGHDCQVEINECHSSPCIRGEQALCGKVLFANDIVCKYDPSERGIKRSLQNRILFVNTNNNLARSVTSHRSFSI